MPGEQISEEELSKMSPEEIAELQRQNCIFCKIANKEVPAKIIHEDNDIICILDINPASEGHILVYPKKHYMIMPHVPDNVLTLIFKNVKLMSRTLLQSLQCKGTTIFIANGVAAGQKSPHVLVHVFPRRENDGLVQLPTYDMSSEQIEKLKNELAPYTNQIFGQRKIKPKIKDAEFSEQKKNDESNHKESKINFDNKTSSKKSGVDSNKESDTRKDGKEDKDGNINLDDISRLFG